MMKLIAKYPVLYLSRFYEVGQELPTNDLDMVKAWLEAGSAYEESEEELSEETVLEVIDVPVEEEQEAPIEEIPAEEPKTSYNKKQGSRKK